LNANPELQWQILNKNISKKISLSVFLKVKSFAFTFPAKGIPLKLA
jgi:hypothetical protein